MAAPYRYKLEVSPDAKTFKAVADETNNTAATMRSSLNSLPVPFRPAEHHRAAIQPADGSPRVTIFGKSAQS
jgi:hypothetical protein